MKNKKTSGIIILVVGLILAVLGVIKGANPIGYMLVGAGIFVILAAVITLLVASKNKNALEPDLAREKPEYRRKKTMLSRPEYEFFQLLKGILNPDKYSVAFQVPLVSVIDKLTQTSYRNELFRVVDFCVVDSVSFAPLLLIELNDASHTRADRIDRDRKVFEICASATLPIVAFTFADTKDPIQIKKTIFKCMLKK